MAIRFTPGGPQTVGTPAQQLGLTSRRRGGVSGRRMSIDLQKKAAAEARRRAEAERKAEEKRREVARKELERLKKEAIAREAASREAARKELGRALARAKAGRSMSAQARAREVFRQVQEVAKIEKERSIKRGSEDFKRSLAIGREKIKKVPTRLQKLGEDISKTKVGKAVDLLIGGQLTERGFAKERQSLNRDIEIFNKRFGGRKLTEAQFNEAQIIQGSLENREKKLEEGREKFSKSAKRKVGRVVFDPVWGRAGSKIEYPKAMTSAFIKLEKFNIKKYTKLTDSAKKRFDKNPTKINKRGLDNAKKSLTTAGSNLGSLQKNINPYLSPSLLDIATVTLQGYSLAKGSKVVDVKFIGKQTSKGNKIITDLAFVTAKGKRVGIARGVTISRGKIGKTIVIGKSGVRAVKMSSGKVKLLKKQAFLGIEKTKAVRAKMVIKSPVKLPTGRINVIRRNIQGFKQVGVGKIATVRGERLFHTGIKFPSGKFITKKASGISLKDFASFSATITKKDLSLIVGKAITSSKDKIRFIGLIKGVSKTGKTIGLSGVQKLQYNKALQKVISVAAASLAKADKIKGLTSAQRIATSTYFAQRAIKAKPALKPTIARKVVSKPKLKVKALPSKVRPSTVSKTRPSTVSKTIVKQRASQVSREAQRVKQILQQVSKERQKLRTRLQQRTLQQQSQRLKLRLKTLQQQKTKLQKIRPGVPLTIPQIRLLKIPLPVIRKKRVVVRKKLPKPVQVFNVYGKSKKKFLKLNVKPLKKNDALSKGSYAVDHTTSKSFKIVAVGKTKTPGKLRKGERNYFNKTKQKFRPYKIKKGRKFVTKPRYIEKRKYGIDTRGEKKGLSIAKHLKQQRRRPAPRRTTRKPARRITPVQRRVPAKRKPSPAQLAALSRGRAKLKKMRKK